MATTYANNSLWGTTSYGCPFGWFNAANIYGNTYCLAGTDANGKRMAFAHEIGHAIGLGHTGSTAALMYSSSAIYTTYGIFTPQADDIAGVNANY